jgi:endonuclease/exonuclease/phosphatase family metal-dependent hydrolase
MKKNRSLFQIIMLGLNLIAVVVLLFSYAAGLVSPSGYWVFALFGLAYPIILLVNLAFVFLWLILWKRYVFLSVVTILLGWSDLHSIVPVHLGSRDALPGIHFRMISFNIHSLYGNQKIQSIPETRSQVTAFLSSQQADVVCLQEFFAVGENFSKTVDRFSQSIDLKYNYFKNYKNFDNKTKINAIATFSRYPVTDTGSFHFPGKSVFAIYTDLAMDEDTIRVYNLHLESIRLSNDDYTFYSQITEPDKEKTPIREGSKKMIWKLRKAWQERARQVQTLKNHMSLCRRPMIICGDFNDTPSSYTYHQLLEDKSDAFREAGTGIFGSTYAGRFPSFRIDYLLFSGDFSVQSYQKTEVDLSDHYPVMAEFTLNK